MFIYPRIRDLREDSDKTQKQIAELLNAKILCGEDRLDGTVKSACGCDMMSDVLAFVKDQAVLMTGFFTPAVLRYARV